MPILILIFFSLFFSLELYAQHEADNWYFGYHSHLSFENGEARGLEGGRVGDNDPTLTEGTACWSDPLTGKLVFYTDGRTVWNSLHRAMPNGTGLMGTPSTTQSALIVPHPGDATLFYIFNPAALSGGFSGIPGFYYSIVDMKLDNGYGRVTRKNTVLIPNDISERVAVANDCAGGGYWVVTHGGKGRSLFYAFHIDKNGLNPVPVVSETPWSGSGGGNIRPSLGNLKFSPDGKRIAIADYFKRALEIFDFDATNGKVKLLLEISDPDAFYEYGCSFSPDNSKLYARRRTSNRAYIAQFDLSEPDAARIRASEYLLDFNSTQAGGMQLGPDGKLYLNQNEDYLAVIEKPNLKGAACSLRVSAIRFPANTNALSNLPNFNDGLFMEGGSPCAAPRFVYDKACEGGFVTFRPTGEITGKTLRWSFAGGIPDSFVGPNPPPVRYDKAGDYVASLVAGEMDTFYDTVRVLSLPKADAGPDLDVCPGTRVRLGSPAISGLQYEWSPAAGLDNTRSAQPFLSPVANMEYYLKVSNAGGCTSYDTVRVNAVRKVLDLSLGTDGGAFPGENLILKLRIRSGKAISALRGRLLFDGAMLSLSKDIPVRSDSGWSVSARNAGKGVIEFEAVGSTEIKNGEIGFPVFIYLSQTRESSLRLELDGPVDDCILVNAPDYTLELASVCAEGIRPVTIGRDDFIFNEISSNPAGEMVSLRYSLGFACPVNITVSNSLGEQVYGFSTEQAAGSYELVLPERLAAGLYFIRMSAADFSATQKIVVAK